MRSRGRSEAITTRLTSERLAQARVAAERDRRTLSNWIEVACERAVLMVLIELEEERQPKATL